MPTTREKVLALVDAVRSLPPDDVSPDTRDFVEMVQIATAMGFDFVGMLVPESDAETDVMVDKLISLLLEVRGDDLPPFDRDRYGEAIGDATA